MAINLETVTDISHLQRRSLEKSDYLARSASCEGRLTATICLLRSEASAESWLKKVGAVVMNFTKLA